MATTANTPSGRYIGHHSSADPRSVEWLGIPYAQAPVGDLPFAAPVAYSSQDLVAASPQPPDCPYVAQPWGSVPGQAWTHADRIMAQESADGYNAMDEDCLRLNVWAPANTDGRKAVMIFLYGGGQSTRVRDHGAELTSGIGFDRGSVNNPAYIGARMAAAQDVVVVAFNYRVNIMGFANAPGSDSNVALRDVRLAIEWVRDNIAAFGGDASSITLFGQSQGAYLISYYAYAFSDDPIAHAFIQQSGTAFSSPRQDMQAKNATWRAAAASIGCTNASDTAVLQCMRAQNLSTILDAWSSAPPTTGTSIPFGPMIDDALIFEDYGQLTQKHRFAQKPFLMGSKDNEAGFYVMRFAGNEKVTLNQTQQDEIGYGSFVCPVALDAAAKASAFAISGVPIYRYEYFGDWPNLSLYAGSGAYHTSETSVVFGTMEALSGDPNTELEVRVSDYMQMAWAAFAKDPEAALDLLAWPRYNQTEDSLIRLGYGDEVVASSTMPASYDAICSKL